jgi:hypothetical protein
MDEGRKRVLLIAAAILAARKLAQYPGAHNVPATICAISDAGYRDRLRSLLEQVAPVGGLPFQVSCQRGSRGDRHL